jgi:hypothetical protein
LQAMSLLLFFFAAGNSASPNRVASRRRTLS